MSVLPVVRGIAGSTDGHLAIYDGSTGEIIKDGGPVPSAAAPGSPVNSVQFNNAGVFAGNARHVQDSTDGSVSIGDNDATQKAAFISDIGITGVPALPLTVINPSGGADPEPGMLLYAPAAQDGAYIWCANSGGTFASPTDSIDGKAVLTLQSVVRESGVWKQAFAYLSLVVSSVATKAGFVRVNELKSDGDVEIGNHVSFKGPSTTGAGLALLGANSPASVLSAPYDWVEVLAADGTPCYMPIWKK